LVLAAISLHWERNYTAPTIRELQDSVGLMSSNTVWLHVRRLVAEGDLMFFEKGSARALVPHWVADAIEAWRSKK